MARDTDQNINPFSDRPTPEKPPINPSGPTSGTENWQPDGRPGKQTNSPAKPKKSASNTGQRTAKAPSIPAAIGRNRNSAELQEQIRRRAYELYLQRGGGDGNADQDWAQAEARYSESRAAANLRPGGVYMTLTAIFG